jgi:DNA-binding SARP family transcriptional activator
VSARRPPQDDQRVPEQLSLNLLGGFTAARGDQPLALPPSCQRLVALIAVKQRPLHRQWICSVLWPGNPPHKAVASLRTALWRLRPMGADRLLVAGPQYLQLAGEVSVDWHTATRLADRLDEGPADPQLAAELVGLLRAGDLLEGWPDSWCVRERHRFRLQRLATLRALASGDRHRHDLRWATS